MSSDSSRNNSPTESEQLNRAANKPESKRAKSTAEHNNDQHSIVSLTTTPVRKQFSQSSLDSIMQELSEQQQVINSKLCESLSKDDFKNQLEIMKTEIIAKSDEKVQKMEGKLFQLEKENEKLKIENTKLTKIIETTEQKAKECDFSAKIALTRTNNLEQYTRKDNIRIFDISDENKDERYDITINKSMNLLETREREVAQR